jgi:hypothetical protein
VTVPSNGWVAQPQVVRVAAINVAKPAQGWKWCVAVSPEDAARIQRTVGAIR